MTKKDEHNEYKERLKRFRWVQWQIVRRHEDYIKFCDKQNFNKWGILREDTSNFSKIMQLTSLNLPIAFAQLISDCIILDDPKNSIGSEKVRPIKKRFFLNKIYDYSKDLSEDECLDICGWLRHVVPISPSSKTFNAENLPQYGNFIYVGINITDDLQKKDLENQIYGLIDLIKESRGTQKEFRLKDINSEIVKLDSFKGVSRQGVEHKIRKLKEELNNIEHNIKCGPSRTTPGKDQSFNYYKTLFQVWDLHIQKKTSIEIIKIIWPEEWSKTAPDEEKLWFELTDKFRKMGYDDWEERAWHEAYSRKSGPIALYMKVNHKIKRMRELFGLFPKEQDD